MVSYLKELIEFEQTVN